jgi:pseudouridine synthase
LAPKLKTLDRILSKAGIGSRTEAREWIAAGRIEVNGRVARDPARWVDLDRDAVAVDGKPIRAAKPIYLLLYKPKGYLTTMRDPGGRPTVYDLLGKDAAHVVPVGRLDLDTSGLLILTNDTQFAEQVMNPEHKISKTYLVKASGILDDGQVAQLRDGVELADGPTRPAAVKRVRNTATSTFLEITITEGRNRQVRRMMEAVGSRVRKLVRTAIGPIQIGSLEIGKSRPLTQEEVSSLAKVRPRLLHRSAPSQAAAGTPGGPGFRIRRNGDGTGPADASRFRPPARSRFSRHGPAN